MKTFITILLIAVSSTFFGQEYNLKQGYLAEGYDVVSYFSNTAEKGDKEFTTTHNAVKFKFSSKKNLDTLKVRLINTFLLIVLSNWYKRGKSCYEP